MQLLHLQPRLESFQDIMETFNINAEHSQGPLIESVFYSELSARSILTVEKMKQGESSSN